MNEQREGFYDLTIFGMRFAEGRASGLGPASNKRIGALLSGSA